MTTREIQARSVLSKSGIAGVSYCVNPYVGCAHACSYCYASFMKRFTGHREPWGEFVDVKVNAPAVLERQIRKVQRPGRVFLSTVTDPYQPVEEVYGITRSCLRVLSSSALPVDILTKSPLVLRDIDLIRELRDPEIGITITTDNDRVRQLFEPEAPSIERRLEALRSLKAEGFSTYVFIGPVLPMNPEALAGLIRPYVTRVLIDGMNYPSKTRGIYTRKNMSRWLDNGFVGDMVMRLRDALDSNDVSVC
jgi:DNA repair photolyase